MIKTLRDAELQIEALKRQQNELIKELKSLKLTEPRTITKEVINQVTEVDSVLTADKSTVIHYLMHSFDKIKAKVLELKNLIVETLTANSATITTLNSTNIDTTNLEFDIAKMNQYIKFFNPAEGRIQVVGGNIVYSRGAYFDGANWFATDSTAILYILAPTGIYTYYNTGLAINAAFAPAQKLLINANTIIPNSVLMTDGAGALMTHSSPFTGTIYVSATLGGPTNLARNFVSGVCTS